MRLNLAKSFTKKLLRRTNFRSYTQYQVATAAGQFLLLPAKQLKDIDEDHDDVHVDVQCGEDILLG